MRRAILMQGAESMLRVSEQAFAQRHGAPAQRQRGLVLRSRAGVCRRRRDGGGAQAGEVASKAAADAFDRDLLDAPPERALKETIEAANLEIHEHARADPSIAGMGTTITAAIVDPASEEVAIGHVGDSRAYRLRGGKLERLTRDHSLVEEMRRKGQLTDEQAEDHPQRSIITRALGPEPEVEVDVQTVPAQPGDVFLLCSDGLTTMLDDERIAGILGGASSLDSAVRALIDEANRAGGRDNITAPSPSASRARRPRPRAGGRYLIGPSAEAAGLSATEVRRRAAAAAAKGSGANSSLRSRSADGCELPPRCSLLRGARRDRIRRLVWQPPGLVPGDRRRRQGRPHRGLPFELPFGIELYEERYASPIQTASLPPRRHAAVTGQDLRSPLRSGLSARRNRAGPGGAVRSARNREPPQPGPRRLAPDGRLCGRLRSGRTPGSATPARSTGPISLRSAAPPTSTRGSASPPPAALEALGHRADRGLRDSGLPADWSHPGLRRLRCGALDRRQLRVVGATGADL